MSGAKQMSLFFACFVNLYFPMTWFKFSTLILIVNCVTNSPNCSQSKSKSESLSFQCLQSLSSSRQFAYSGVSQSIQCQHQQEQHQQVLSSNASLSQLETGVSNDKNIMSAESSHPKFWIPKEMIYYRSSRNTYSLLRPIRCWLVKQHCNIVQELHIHRPWWIFLPLRCIDYLLALLLHAGTEHNCFNTKYILPPQES